MVDSSGFIVEESVGVVRSGGAVVSVVSEVKVVTVGVVTP